LSVASRIIEGSDPVPRRVKAVRAGAAALLLTAVGLGCAVENHYKLLSFFFDGVPDPALIEAGRSEVERVRAAGGTVYTHDPYKNEQCDGCHRNAQGRMVMKVTAVVCMNCHKDVPDQHRFMHGPVAIGGEGACLWCHSPHESTVKSLLRAEANTVCRQCHDASLARRRIPAHADESQSCVECHSGHGGSNRYFLHVNQVAPAMPAADPSSRPPTPPTPPTPPAEGEP
jgi:predicted CXXCH cytochrome family protein